jgi:acyl carrier protein
VNDNVLEQIVQLVQTTGKIENVSASEDFYEAGFSSINALQLLMDLEAAFDVTIPDDEFVAARTCLSLHTLIARLAKGSQ